MARGSFFSVFFSIILYTAIGYLLVVSLFPALLMLFIVFAAVIGISILINYIRIQIHSRKYPEPEMDEYGSRKTTVSVLEIKEAEKSPEESEEK